jgi:tetratricopeptide (TPR) repeat protein
MRKFREVLSRWESGELSMMEAGELLGMSERQFRRYRDRYEEAEENYRLALAEWRKHPQFRDGFARTKYNLAGVHRAQGRYGEAEAAYLELLKDAERRYGPASLEGGSLLAELANILRQGKLAQAQSFGEKALSVTEKLSRPGDEAVALRAQTLAAVYRAQGRLDKAQALLERALASYNERLGAGDPQLATSLNSLAEISSARGDYPEAESLASRAAALWEKGFGPHHPNVAVALNNLAQAIRLQERFAEAEPLYQRSVAILEEPAKNWIWRNARLCRSSRTGQGTKAADNYRRALNLAGRPEDHPG